MAQKPNLLPKLSSLPKNFQDWDIGDKYEIIKQVGSGSYGYVVEAKNKETGIKVAIKRCNGIFDDLIDCKRILREIMLLRKLKHPNLISLIEVLPPKDPKDFDTLYIVMEYCQSDLKKLIKSPIHLENVHIETLAYNLLLGLKYLHTAEVLHRDLKPANVLINEDCTVKICDFGLSRAVEGIEGTHIYDKDHEEAAEKEIMKGFEDKNPKPKLEKNTKKLIKQSSKKVKKMNRELTGHVVTRWYRAPELILLEKNYTSEIDVWSVGCIFAELQGMLKENAATFMDRTPLFPGTSCFPLSPDRNSAVKKGGFPHSNHDQLAMIFQVLGTPCEKDMDFITDSKAIEYIKSFPYMKKVDFKDLYTGSTDESIDMLDKTIVFNPRLRITIDQALNHPVFYDVRDKSKEISSPEPIILEFERNISDDDLTKDFLRKLFLEEISYYHKI